jgi:hypothetical protein
VVAVSLASIRDMLKKITQLAASQLVSSDTCPFPCLVEMN